MAKQRPRFNRQTGKAYTPDTTANYENFIKSRFADRFPAHVPDDMPVTLHVNAIFPIPKSWTQKKTEAAIHREIYPGKPDWDNIGKIVSDALNGIAWTDDARIKEAHISKCYGTRPGLAVLIEIEEREDQE